MSGNWRCSPRRYGATAGWRYLPASAPSPPATLASALTSAGHSAQLSLGGIRTDADTAEVGRVALAAGVPLTELRPADGAGLEEMFLELTADTQREGAAA